MSSVTHLSYTLFTSYFSGDMGKQLLSVETILEILNLASNDIEILQPKLFSNLSKLKHLDLSHNQIRDVMDGQFQDLGVLRSLNLSSNRLNGFNQSVVVSLVRYDNVCP